ncbi:adenylyl-sulfate kinase [Janibacter cremeus]|uniref:adenylyl-sulfate kinase n=1 Tax=Janibacter cremeus TaxID=1285192 RepID=UPI0023F8A02E|nr:adenylyl-sulfate kinase [Janibacter cremeus]WEV78211.1 adenylyl-sulfate kinase [Janibacter cremeus]WEV78291.1 adenylyl-sulfate kinase [Janibacter cremeus]
MTGPARAQQYCPPFDQLDALERLRVGASAPQGPTLTIDEDVRRAAQRDGLEVVDPEGVPIARFPAEQIGSDGPTGTPEWLGNGSPRPYERLYLSPAQVRATVDKETLTIVVDRRLNRNDITEIRNVSTGRPVLLLVLCGPTMSPYTRGVNLLRRSLEVAKGLTGARVIAVPLDPRIAATDPELQDEVVSAYAPGPVAWLGTHTTRLPGTHTVDRTGESGGLVVFFTGLSGSGKSTVARAVRESILEEDGRPVSILDGDVVRRHLSAGLTFSPEDRETNIRRIGWVAAEIAYHGGAAICSPIAPYDSTRKAVRAMATDRGGDFVLIHVSTPVEECARRDRKGLYAKAQAGELKDFTGVSAPYEAPTDADLDLDTSSISIDEARDQVLDLLRERGHLADPTQPEWTI